MIYDSALREAARRRLEQIEKADLVVGIPCYNNAATISNVIKKCSEGLSKYYRDCRALIMVSDGGSTDDTREVANDTEIWPFQERIVTIYRGVGGKGTAIRAIFEAVLLLEAKACAVLDSDLRSITPEWVKYLFDPILLSGYDFVAPVYIRYKYDATITNNIVYTLTRALYGKRVRQPIGGDFGFGRALCTYYSDHDIWMTDVARYGIDIWMTTTAITQGVKICQANLGVKVHDAKDPGTDLGAMFRQVVMTLFSLMETHERTWLNIRESTPVETFGLQSAVGLKPEPVSVNVEKLIENFKLGYQLFGSVWQEVLSPQCFEEIKRVNSLEGYDFIIPIECWVRILYDFAADFHTWPDHRLKLVNVMSPLYYMRIASFINQSLFMDSEEAEQLVEEQAEAFEKAKDYLINLWNEKRKLSKKVARKLDML